MARSKQTQVETEPVMEQAQPSVAGTTPRPRNDTNLVVLTGRLGNTPELRYVGQSGVPVAEFRLATGRIVGSGEEAREETSWITVKCWNRLAEIVGEYLASGRRVLITGRLHEERWQDRESGQNRARLVVVAERIEFLDGPRTGGEGALEELPFDDAA
jgi:single-strand DNA-binding protein